MNSWVDQTGLASSLGVRRSLCSTLSPNRRSRADFNFQPDDAAYSLLVGDPLLPRQAANLAFSRVVHRSVDPSVPVTAPKADAEDEEGAEAAESDPDKIITNARAAAPEDGLLSDEELRTLFERAVRPVSAYDEALRNVEPAIREGLTFGSRTEVPAERRGAFEPVWTSYTHVCALTAQDVPRLTNTYAVLENSVR